MKQEHHFLWWTRAKNPHKHELGFRCSGTEITKVKWIFMTSSPKELPGLRSQTLFLDQEIQRSKAYGKCTCPKICSLVNKLLIKPRPSQKPVWFPRVHHSRVLNNPRRVMPTCSLDAIITKLIPVTSTRWSIEIPRESIQSSIHISS